MPDQANSSDPNAISKSLAASSIHLQPFTPHRPEAWFSRVETIFCTKKITSAMRKADAVLEFLPDEAFEQTAGWLKDLESRHLRHTEGAAEVILQHAAHPEIQEIPQPRGGPDRRQGTITHVQATVAAHYTVRQGRPTRVNLGPHERGTPHKTTTPGSSSHAKASTMPLEEFLVMVHEVHMAHKAPDPSQPAAAVAAPCRTKQNSDTKSGSDPDEPDTPIYRGKPKQKKQEPPEGICFFHWRFENKARKCDGLPILKKHAVVTQMRPIHTNFSGEQTGCLIREIMPAHHCLSSRYKGQTCFSLKDERSDMESLVDTGACRSLIPNERLNPSPSTSLHVSTASRAPLTMYRRREMKIAFSGKEQDWSLITADVTTALLGADFLTAHNLLVNTAAKQLIPRTAQESSPQKPSRRTTMKASSQREEKICPTVPNIPPKELRELTRIRRRIQRQPEARPNKTSKTHHSAPHRDQRTPDPFTIQMAGPRETHLHEEGIQRAGSGNMPESPQPMGGTLHMVPKSDRTWRPWRDYRQLNVKTKSDRYPQPNIADITNKMNGARIFTKIDLLKDISKPW
ncbi:uncharacterized protein [Macrobrachium rosenbergii]|uniref:uncharacterized protein n=1 Tax=Macrobrachium rosenbergii TaxID=79674 RepID=UPI0034D46989